MCVVPPELVVPSVGSVSWGAAGRESVRGDSRLRREREGVRRGRHGLAVWWPFQLNKQNTPKHDEPGSWKYVRVCYEVRFLTVSNSILQTVRKHKSSLEHRSTYKQRSHWVKQKHGGFYLLSKSIKSTGQLVLKQVHLRNGYSSKITNVLNPNIVICLSRFLTHKSPRGVPATVSVARRGSRTREKAARAVVRSALLKTLVLRSRRAREAHRQRSLL